MMGIFLKSVVVVGILATTVVSSVKDYLSPLPGVIFKEVKGKHPRTPDKPTHNYLKLKAIKGNGRNSRSAASVLGAVHRASGGYGYENINSETAYGTQYGIQILVDGNPVQVILDTGSSDTWVVHYDFECITEFGETVPQSACYFGPLYQGDFQDGDIYYQHMWTQYGDGELVYGPMGLADITVGNITVKQQQIALANMTYWIGDNVTSGIAGFAYPSITDDFYGTGTEHGWEDEIQYPPLFTSMTQQGLTPPVFAVALERNSSDGIISFGGPPPIPNVDYSNVAELPIIVTNLNDNPYAAWEYSFYTIIPDGFSWNDASDTTHIPCIVDTGTTMIYLPQNIAEEINNAYQPAATFLDEYGAFFTECNAIVPFFSVLLGGKEFVVNPVDMMYRGMGWETMTGLCPTAINSGGAGPFILGMAFMQNTVTIFDVGNSTMRFASRPYY